ncbi:YgdI/YgdR family lipoprotein [Candidatus Pantoea deserta]|uniref:YgdI/YgdR family lipoprotein n=1 Tax=Candidatus Pantoea deserta TaxID=1869313 RepID=A0A3N4P7Y1_9GAMM|nr:YgdI/YgdR family lipoprotein [Pantoea deserta]RPE03448.1 YgdI/YgdR family lipoprotein [Pantoea deserta]
MRELASVAVLMLAVATLSGCSSDYVMATKDGQMIMTEGKPTIDKETGLVKYVDQSGHEVQINGDEVSTIIER